MGYTALYKITASFRQAKTKKFGVMRAGRQVLRQSEDLRVKQAVLLAGLLQAFHK